MIHSLFGKLRVKWVVGSFTLASVLVHIAEFFAVLVLDVDIVGGYWISTFTSVIITLGLVYGVYLVISSDIPQKREPRIVAWFVAGLIGFLLVNVGFMYSEPEAPAFRIITWIRWASVIGGGIGFAIGVLETRLIVREVEAVRHRIHEKQLQRERDRLDQFASAISHDLRNPLNVITGRVKLAQDEIDSEHLDSIEASALRMENMIEDMLMLARTGEEIDEWESIELETVVNSCWETVESPDADLEIDVEGTIKGDESRVRQAFENLLRNAIEHGSDEVTIRIGGLEDGFYVEDDGPGIPQEKRDTVFDVGQTSSESGTGLGLAIVKEIVEAHGWDIEVVEGTDGGARFEIRGVEFVE